ncbi:MAG: CPBP family glutamic-type intramembrane protease [Cyanobacteria bacterium J06650_10]
MTTLTFNKPLFVLIWLAGFIGELYALWIDIPLDAFSGSAESVTFSPFLQGRKGTPLMRYVVGSILISAIVFGLLHLPTAAVLSPQLTPALVLYIVVGNVLFGTVAGYLYWRIGLESAILSHMLFHVALTIVQSLAPSLTR